MNDLELLREYHQQSSEAAFAELVRRHVNLVYSAALRHVGIPAQAEEITQAVFIILARKAGALRPDTILEGWLQATTRLTALRFQRGERRRQIREQEAFMQSTLNQPETQAWDQIQPLLDDAISRLGQKDRDAVILRYFGEKSLGEVAAALNVTEAAAQSRVHRALEKLRRIFSKRGVMLTASVIAGAISAHSVQAAPAGLAKTISVIAIAKGAAAGTTTLTLVKGALKIMAWTKYQLALGLGMAALFIGGLAVLATLPHETNRGFAGKETHHPKIMIKVLVIRTPTANVDAILKDYTRSYVQADPFSPEFRNSIGKYQGVKDLGDFIINTYDGGQATVFSGNPTKISGTNADIGMTVAVTPNLQNDSKISLKVKAEWRELTAEASPTIQTTTVSAETLPCDFYTTICIRGEIGAFTTQSTKPSGKSSETMLVYLFPLLLPKKATPAVPQATQAYQYEANGRLNVQQLNRGVMEEVNQALFHVYVRDSKWKIQIRASDPGGPPEVLHTREISSDGTFVYNFGLNDYGFGNDYGNYSWGGSVTPDEVPFFGVLPTIPVIWLALADSFYLDQNSESMCPPYSIDVLRPPQAISVVRRPQSPRLPETMSFMADGYFRGCGQPNQKWRAPYDQGFTNAIFTATGFTNIGGVELPSEFKFTVYQPARADGLEKKLDQCFVYQGYITNISPVCSISNFVPEIPAGSIGHIYDLRFAYGKAIVPQAFQYQATNWLSETEVRQLPGFASYEKSIPALSNFIPVGMHGKFDR